MKKLNQILIITITFILMLFTTHSVCAQWDVLTYIPFIQTSNPFTAGVGIGQFPSSASFLSAFHVNTTFTSPTTNFAGGEVFRTTAADQEGNDISTFWRMERMTGGIETEYGVAYSLTPADDNSICPTPENNDGSNFYMQASLNLAIAVRLRFS